MDQLVSDVGELFKLLELFYDKGHGPLPEGYPVFKEQQPIDP